MNDRPVELIVSDDLQRSRPSVFFRLLLAIPHLIWLGLWGIAASVAVVANWFATLLAGRSPDGLHDFLAAYVRYRTHVIAYLFLIAEPFPQFTGRAGSYPIDPRIEGPRPQNRWIVLFRGLLAVPAILLEGAYGSLLFAVALLGWFACLATGRMPLGLRNAGALALRYSAQTDGYVLLLTDAYPYSGPVRPPAGVAASVAVTEPLAEPTV